MHMVRTRPGLQPIPVFVVVRGAGKGPVMLSDSDGHYLTEAPNGSCHLQQPLLAPSLPSGLVFYLGDSGPLHCNP